MIPLRSDVQTLCQSLLGDTEVPGQIVTSQSFESALQSAYQELTERLQSLDSPNLRRESYYLLQPYTVSVSPLMMGITNFGSPESIQERGSITSIAVTNAVPSTDANGNPIVTVTLASNHGRQTGDWVEFYGINGLTDDINDSWNVVFGSNNTLVLRGCEALGTYTSGGWMIYSSELSWSEPLTPATDTSQLPQNPSSSLGFYSWQRERFKFPPLSSARELKLIYRLSGRAPASSSSSMGIDGSLNFLGHRAAQKIAEMKVPKRFVELQTDANAFLNSFLQSCVLEMQTQEPIIPPPYQQPRNYRYPIF